MIRITLSSLAFAAILALGAVTPAASETLKGDNQPTACDCSNCSAEHCQGTGGGDYSAVVFVGGWGASQEGPKGLTAATNDGASRR